MKHMTKKILAGLGIGLTLASGGLMMTGCTETPVTDAQVEKVFEALDNANEFMEDTKELIDNQNEKLDNLNNEWGNLNESLENQNQELTNIKNILSEENKNQLIEKL